MINLETQQLNQQSEGKEFKMKIITNNQFISPFNYLNKTVKEVQKNEELLYVIQNENQIFPIGFMIDHQDFYKSFTKLKKEVDEQELNVNIKLKKNLKINQEHFFRFKINQIFKQNDQFFALAVPFKDKKVQKLSAIEQLEKIREAIYQIKELNIEINRHSVFIDLDLNKYNFDEFSYKQIDRLIYQIADSIYIYEQSYLNQQNLEFIQLFLQSNSLISRIYITLQHLNYLKSIVNKVVGNLKQADLILNSQYIREKAVIANQLLQNKKNQGVYQQNKSGQKNYRAMLDQIPEESSRLRIEQEINRMEKMDPSQSEYNKISSYLDEVFSIPWNQFSEPYWDLKHARDVLENELFGLEDVKKRVYEMISLQKINKNQNNQKNKGFVLLIYGPPGTGKSSIAKLVAKCLKRNSRFISFAGVSDTSFIKGHKRTYVDSQPGIFVQELIKAKTMNPVFILDEIDKVGQNSAQGNPYYSLLEILNTEESHNFTDHYMNIPVDFSNCIYICTANDIGNMLSPLKSRLEIIEVNAYIQEQKLKIGNEYIIPQVNKDMNISNLLINYNDKVLKQILQGWCYYEAGVREFKKCYEKICRKHIINIIKQYPEIQEIQDEQVKSKNIQLNLLENTQNQLIGYLGTPIYDSEIQMRNQQLFETGVVNILAASSYAGSVNKVEVKFKNYGNNFSMTGNLKNVLEESINIAYLNCLKYLNEDQIKEFNKKKKHIHFCENDVQKDGPSAGGALTCAFLSLALNKKISPIIAQTGEITLNGNITKIGGLKQKIIAAKSINIKKIILSIENYGDVIRMEPLLLKDLDIYIVTHFDQIYELVFQDQIFEDKPVKNVKLIKDGLLIVNQQYNNYEKEI